jgi:regulator of sigma E protease
VLLDLLQSIGSSLWAVFLIILFFGGSIFVHELGHFLAARRRGVHVERFSIGFGPKIFSWHGKDGVEYRLSWLPLGGYVALPQLADMRGIEGESAVDVAQLPQLSYTTKILVFAAGAAFNVLFAFLLATALWLAGRPEMQNVTTTRIGYVLPTVTPQGGREVPSPARAAGLKVNDTIRTIDGRIVNDWPDVQEALLLGTGVDPNGERRATLTIERGGSTLEVVVHPLRLGDEQTRMIGIAPAYDVIVEKIAPGSPAEAWGLRAGDRVLGIEDTPVTNLEFLSDFMAEHPSKGFVLIVSRDGRSVRLAAPAIEPKAPHVFSGVKFATGYDLLYQTPWSLCSQIVKTTFRTLWSWINPRGDVTLSNFSGPIGIGVGFWHAAQSQYAVRFAIWFTVLLNLNLAVFNLLPIPVLDGGQMVFATIGRIRSRALPADFIMTTQSVFIVLLFSMILYVSFFDVRRIVRDVRTDRSESQEPAAPNPKPAAAPAAP